MRNVLGHRISLRKYAGETRPALLCTCDRRISWPGRFPTKRCSLEHLLVFLLGRPAQDNQIPVDCFLPLHLAIDQCVQSVGASRKCTLRTILLSSPEMSSDAGSLWGAGAAINFEEIEPAFLGGLKFPPQQQENQYEVLRTAAFQKSM